MDEGRASQHPKPVILLNIDTLMPAPLEEAVQNGKAPALQFLMENGRYFADMVSSFPTMSVTIDSSLLTGTYADQHHIPGLNWYSHKDHRIINYGTGFRETFKLGLHRVIKNMLARLNNEDLSPHVRTIFEELAQKGFSSASINSFVYRGNTPHRLRIPKLLAALTRLEQEDRCTTHAPPVFSLGAFSTLRPWSMVPQMFAGNYKFTARELRYLIRQGKLPAFTLCVFQDLDLRIHFKGPMDIKGISKIDREIQKILHLYSSWEEAIQQHVWLVIGDNGQTSTGFQYKKMMIDLRKIFNTYRMAKLNRPVREQDQIVLCVNQRMAYIYVLDQQVPFTNLIRLLQADERIDLIAWKDGGSIQVVSGEKEGTFRFRPHGEYTNRYGQRWVLEGSHKLLDLSLTDDHHIQYGDYPDAMARLYGALHSHNGHIIVVNAKPGCEFKAEATPFHLGGAAHGSLHKQESLVPLIITGTTETPVYPRIIDLKEYILRLILMFSNT